MTLFQGGNHMKKTLLFVLFFSLITGIFCTGGIKSGFAADDSADPELQLAREAGFVPDDLWDRGGETISWASFCHMLRAVVAETDESAAAEFEKYVGTAMTADIPLDREIAAICLYYASTVISLPENAWVFSEHNNWDEGVPPCDGSGLNELIGDKCWKEMRHRYDYGDAAGAFPYRFNGGDAWDMHWDGNVGTAAYFGLLSRRTEEGRLFFDYDAAENTMHMDRDVSCYEGIRAVSRFYAMCHRGELFEKQMRDANAATVHKKVITDYSTVDLVADIKIGTHFNQAYTDALPDFDHFGEVLTDQGYVTGYSNIYDKVRDRWFDRYTLKSQREILKAYHDAGFNVIRLPVTWTPYMDDTTYKIDDDFLAYVEFYVNMILDEGMYCIINTMRDYPSNGDYAFVDGRWNNRWMEPEYADSVNGRISELWRQIAEHFRDYDEHLIFEVMNEPSESIFPDGAAYQYQKNRINELNDLFVETVRATGGNNSLRTLMLSCVWGNFFLETLEPPADDHIIADYHCYFVYNGPLGIFNLPDNVPANELGYFTEWSSENPTLQAFVGKEMKQIRVFMEKTGVPVIIGEASGSAFLTEEENLDLLTFEIASAKALNVPVILWDGYYFVEGLSEDEMNEVSADFLDGLYLYNPDTGEWQTQRILDAIMDIVE